ncbi:MAG: LysR family transcriptional regulator [Rhodospirillales bacterium]
MSTAGPNLSDVDLRLLRVFQCVVQYNGFSAAQEHLGLSQATISNHMIHLEDRLGMRLCERGRGGFVLTEQGKSVHSAMLDLFGAIENFRSVLGAAKGELTGNLNFGTVDAMYTNPKFDLAGVLEDFASLAPKVSVDLDIVAPQALSQGMLSGRYHVVLTPTQRYPKSFRSVAILTERQMLYCGARHPLYETPDSSITRAMLTEYPFAARSYMSEEELFGIKFRATANTAYMEGTALLILSGQYIGFLPDHFAERWVSSGQMRVLSPDTFAFDDTFHAVYRRKDPNPVAQAFSRCLERRGD